jgi:phytoene desaturase
MPETVKKAGAFVRNIRSQVRSMFKDHRLQQILEFPVLFLGAKPADTPEFYNFMNHADLSLGTWYPMGGMHEIVKAMQKIAEEQGVKISLNSAVDSFIIQNGAVKGVRVGDKEIMADVVVSGADYHHTESLLPEANRQFNDKYWQQRTMAPSSLLFYLGVKGKVEHLLHHNLFFDESFDQHASEIYDQPEWPENPLFYACVPSKTDPSVAPQGDENIFILIPIAPDLKDDEHIRDQWFEKVMKRLEAFCGQEIRSRITYKKSFCVNDFKEAYNSFKGNAYGMANTLFQTAYFRPGLRSKKLKNLYFTGQLTVPGPGVPPAIISGEVVSGVIKKDLEL